MSFYDDASLIMIPSGVKTGKVYSQKPMDSDGQFTFTRASEATRLVDGVVTKVRTNSLLQSNDFDTTPWSTTRASFTGGQSGYDGANNAWAFVDTADNSTHLIVQSVTSSSVATFSVYAKAGAVNFIAFRYEDATVDYAYFDLSNGTLGTVDADYIDAKITSVGGGWYRCEAARTSANKVVLLATQANNDPTYAGAGTTALYIQNAQLEQGLVSTPYIATTTVAVSEGPVANMPRLNSVAGGCPSLLLEPQRTNLITQSEYFGGWDINSDNSITVTDNSTTSPDGTQNAAKIEFDGSGYSYIRMAYTASAGVFSIYVKKGNWRYLGFRNDGGGSHSVWDFDTQTFSNVQTNHTMSFEALGDGWYRIMDYVSVSTGGTLRGVAITDTTGTETNPSVPAGSYVYLWGGQGENSATYATSYIPNYGTAAGVTRVADACSNSSVSTSTDFTIFFEAKDFCLINGGTGGSYDDIQFVFSPSGGAYDVGGSYHIYANSLYYFDGSANTPFGPIYNSQTNSKFALVKRGNQGVIYANGVKVLEATLPSGADAKVINWDTINLTPSLTDAQGDVFGSNYKQLLKFDTALTDTELATLTTL